MLEYKTPLYKIHTYFCSGSLLSGMERKHKYRIRFSTLKTNAYYCLSVGRTIQNFKNVDYLTLISPPPQVFERPSSCQYG